MTQGERARRLPAVLVVATLLVAGGAADRARRPSVATGPVPPPAPVAAPAGALSATWYCAAATAAAGPEGFADGAVIVANAGDQARRGSVTFVPSGDAPPVRVPLEVGPRSLAVLRHQDALRAPFAAALVEVDGGEVVVEHSVSGPLGADVAPCAPAASSRWHFADGGTTRGSRHVLALYNPFPEDAIVDLSFATDQGRVVPQALQAVVVPAGRLVPVDVSAHVLRRRAVSTSVVARRGRLVAERLQTYDGTEGRRGLALVPGAPAPALLWYFPEGGFVAGMVERMQFYNPGPREAHLLVEVALEEGAAEPFELVVPARGRHTLRLDGEDRVPPGVGHALTVRSTNGVGVVVERSIDAARPAPRAGLASTLGSPVTARRWVFAAGLATADVDEWIVVVNPGTREAVLDVRVLADGREETPPGLAGVRVPPGRRLAVRMADHLRRAPLPLLVTASQPIVAERGIYRVRAPGISMVMGIPLRD